MQQTLIDIVRKFIKAYNSFDIEEMLSLLHNDIHFLDISEGKVNAETKGKAEFEKLAKQSAALFKERKQQIVALIEKEDIFEVEIKYQAVLAVDLPNGMKKGNIINIQGRSEYRIKDNLIISIRDIS